MSPKAWKSNAEQKALLESGQVTLRGMAAIYSPALFDIPSPAHDFFRPQPADLAGRVSAFHMRFVLHNWPHADCIKILKHIHAAASADTKLIIVDDVIPYACPTPATLIFNSESLLNAVPSPLLPNLGAAMADAYGDDLMMASLFGSQQRTIGEFKDMTEEAGWKIEVVHQTDGTAVSQVVCVKI